MVSKKRKKAKEAGRWFASPFSCWGLGVCNVFMEWGSCEWTVWVGPHFTHSCAHGKEDGGDYSSCHSLYRRVILHLCTCTYHKLPWNKLWVPSCDSFQVIGDAPNSHSRKWLVFLAYIFDQTQTLALPMFQRFLEKACGSLRSDQEGDGF